MDRLGDTVIAIAREKAAIIERGDLAVTGARGDALAVIRRRARRVGVPLTEVHDTPLVSWDRDGIEVELPALGRTRVGLRGRHQAANVAVADALLDALAEAGIARAEPAARRSGYAAAVWPGRLELLTIRGRDVLLDGAHNPAGAAALAIALDDLRPFLTDGPLTLVTASMGDKDVAGIIGALATSRALIGATVLCTRVDVARSMPAEELAARWKAGLPGGRISAEPDHVAALDRALSQPAPAGPLVVAGSLYLVGAVRGQLVDDPDLRDPEGY
jgi:dihydrofolate synthase/folylpolyglutamate synthase